MHERTVVVLTTKVCTVLSVVMSTVTYTIESILTHIKTWECWINVVLLCCINPFINCCGLFL